MTSGSSARDGLDDRASGTCRLASTTFVAPARVRTRRRSSSGPAATMGCDAEEEEHARRGTPSSACARWRRAARCIASRTRAPRRLCAIDARAEAADHREDVGDGSRWAGNTSRRRARGACRRCGAGGTARADDEIRAKRDDRLEVRIDVAADLGQLLHLLGPVAVARSTDERAGARRARRGSRWSKARATRRARALTRASSRAARVATASTRARARATRNAPTRRDRTCGASRSARGARCRGGARSRSGSCPRPRTARR